MKGKKKRIISIMMCLAVLFTSISFTELIKASDVETVLYTQFDNVQEYRGEDKKIPTLSGYVFAGWYETQDGSSPLGRDAADSATSAYAKFVPEGVLNVKCQLTQPDAQTEAVSLRMVTTVDSLRYCSVGFRMTLGDYGTKDITSETVFEELLGYIDGNGITYKPSIFSKVSEYFMAYTITDIATSYFDTEITLVPVWITMDGTEVTGISKGFTITEAQTVLSNQVTVSGKLQANGFSNVDYSDVTLSANGNVQGVTMDGAQYTTDVAKNEDVLMEFSTDEFYGKKTVNVSNHTTAADVNMVHKVNDNVDRNGTTYANAQNFTYNEDGTVQSPGSGTNQVTYIQGLESENFMVSAKFTATAKSNGGEVHFGYRLATGTTADEIYQFMCRASGYRFLGPWASRIAAGSSGGMLTYLAESGKYTEADTEIELGLVRQGNKYYMVYTWPDGKVAVDTLEFVAKENTDPQIYDIYYNGAKQTSTGGLTEYPLYIDGPSKVGFLVENVNAKIEYSYSTNLDEIDEYLTEAYTVTGTISTTSDAKNQIFNLENFTADKFMINGTFTSNGESTDEIHYGYQLKTSSHTYKFLRRNDGYRFVSEGWTDRINKTGLGLYSLPGSGNTNSVKIEFGLVRDGNKYYLINTLSDNRVVIDTLEFRETSTDGSYEIYYNGVKQVSQAGLETFPLYIDGACEVGIWINGTATDVSYSYTKDERKIGAVIAGTSGTATTTTTAANQVTYVEGLKADRFMISGTYTSKGDSSGEMQFGYRLRTSATSNEYYQLIRRATGYRFVSNNWDSRIGAGYGLTELKQNGTVNTSTITVKFALVRDGNTYYMINTLENNRVVVDTLEFVAIEGSSNYNIYYNGDKQTSVGGISEFPLYINGESEVGILLSGSAADVSYSYTTDDAEIDKIVYALGK